MELQFQYRFYCTRRGKDLIANRFKPEKYQKRFTFPFYCMNLQLVVTRSIDQLTSISRRKYNLKEQE